MKLAPSAIHISDQHKRTAALIAIYSGYIALNFWIYSFEPIITWYLNTISAVFLAGLGCYYSPQIIRFLFDAKPVSSIDTYAGINVFEIVRELIDNDFKEDGFTKMPRVCIIDTPMVNAFATGPSKDNAMVCVTTGIINLFREAESKPGQAKEWLQAVLCHEIGHVKHHDIFKGFAIFVMLSPILSFPYVASFFINVVSTIIVLGAIAITRYFSRRNEYAADNTAAKVGRSIALAEALMLLKGNGGECKLASRLHTDNVFKSVVDQPALDNGIWSQLTSTLNFFGARSDNHSANPENQFFINNTKWRSEIPKTYHGAAAILPNIMDSLSTHPPTIDRIVRLENGAGHTFTPGM